MQQTSAIVTARGFRRSFVTLPAQNKIRAARDAGDLPVSTVHVRKVESTRNCLPQVPVHRRTSRARCLIGLIPASPGGVTKPSFWERPFYPPLSEVSHRMRRIWDTHAPDPETPFVARGQRAGHSRLQPPCPGCEPETRPPFPTRIPRRLEKRPSWIETGALSPRLRDWG